MSLLVSRVNKRSILMVQERVAVLQISTLWMPMEMRMIVLKIMQIRLAVPLQMPQDGQIAKLAC